MDKVNASTLTKVLCPLALLFVITGYGRGVEPTPTQFGKTEWVISNTAPAATIIPSDATLSSTTDVGHLIA
jgi:hypothetical protein